MNNIVLIFTGLGIKNINQADVFIYDLNNKLLFKKKTCNGILNVCLKEKCFYKIKAISHYETIYKTIYINNCIITLNFSNSLVKNNFNSRILYLTDYNYPKLPIEKGTIILG